MIAYSPTTASAWPHVSGWFRVVKDGTAGTAAGNNLAGTLSITWAEPTPSYTPVVTVQSARERRREQLLAWSRAAIVLLRQLGLVQRAPEPAYIAPERFRRRVAVMHERWRVMV